MPQVQLGLAQEPVQLPVLVRELVPQREQAPVQAPVRVQARVQARGQPRQRAQLRRRSQEQPWPESTSCRECTGRWHSSLHRPKCCASCGSLGLQPKLPVRRRQLQ